MGDRLGILGAVNFSIFSLRPSDHGHSSYFTAALSPLSLLQYIDKTLHTKGTKKANQTQTHNQHNHANTQYHNRPHILLRAADAGTAHAPITHAGALTARSFALSRAPYPSNITYHPSFADI